MPIDSKEGQTCASKSSEGELHKISNLNYMVKFYFGPTTFHSITHDLFYHVETQATRFLRIKEWLCFLKPIFGRKVDLVVFFV